MTEYVSFGASPALKFGEDVNDLGGRLIRAGEQVALLAEVPWYGADLIEIPEPSRVAFAGCWHARADLVEPAMRAVKQAGAEVIVHTGDFLYTSPQANQMLFVVEHLAAYLGLFVVVVRGNHDDPALYRKAVELTRRRNKGPECGGVADGFARLSPHVLHAPNGLRWTWRGVEFVALGGAYSVDRPARIEGVSYWSGEVASGREIKTVARGGHAEVMVTHDIPAGTRLPFPATRPGWWDMEGAEAHRDRLKSAVDVVRPDWIVGGHMHMRFSDGMFLEPEVEGGHPHQVRVEVLDRIESGVAENLLIADLCDGEIVQVS